MKFTNYEKETIINFNREEEFATVYTRDKTIIRKLEKLSKKFPEDYKLNENRNQYDDEKYFLVRKNLVGTFREPIKPRELTEEQREKYRNQFKENMKKAKDKAQNTLI